MDNLFLFLEGVIKNMQIMVNGMLPKNLKLQSESHDASWKKTTVLK